MSHKCNSTKLQTAHRRKQTQTVQNLIAKTIMYMYNAGRPGAMSKAGASELRAASWRRRSREAGGGGDGYGVVGIEWLDWRVSKTVGGDWHCWIREVWDRNARVAIEGI